jgi:hypothetical protein
MAVEAPNVLPLTVAAERYGIAYPTLRELVNAGVFTRHVFEEQGREKPPIFVAVAELEAWKAGGAEAVVKLRTAPAVEHDLGGES